MNGTSGSSGFSNGRSHQPSSNPILVLEPVNDTFALKSLELPEHTKVKIGRQTGVTTAPHPSNGYFDSKVLSRVHAEVWSEGSKVFIRDLKSSNGTFLNGRRLCPENTESEPFELNQNDSLEFGIDIMDENGALLHEKVSCKIYISRMSYPTPGSSPQDSHAKIKSVSPARTGVNSVKTNSVSAPGGQSENIDLIISRLQNELTRSQETYADLGFLKHGLGELEKSMISASSHDQDKDVKARMTSTNGSSSTEYQRLLGQRDKDHAAEISRLVKGFDEIKAQLEAQRAREIKMYQEENETLRRSQEKASEALERAASKLDFIMARTNTMIQEHKQELEAMQKNHEAALENLEAKHKDDINRLVLEADAEQEGLTRKHNRELAEAVAKAQAGASDKATESQNHLKAEKELTLLKKEVESLQQSKDAEIRKVETLIQEKLDLHQRLESVKADLRKRDLQASQGSDLETLTPTLSTSNDSTGNKGVPLSTTATARSTADPEENDTLSSGQKTKSIKDTTFPAHVPGDSEPRHDFSWSQFVFPIAKKNQPGLHQPSTMLLSGGFMLVGLGVYALWHKVGMTAN
ncbi:hypothetical protein EDD11_003149 [Mortierella claussenii]|nr:hypothetical protein EDD11_003149 [Mortierella claussenii]